MKTLTKILVAVATAAGIGAVASCVNKKNNAETDEVVYDVETNDDCDVDCEG